MSAPSHDDDQLKLEIFDRFSKTVMKCKQKFRRCCKNKKEK